MDNIFYVLESFYIGPHKKDLEEFGKKIALLNYHNAISFLGISNVELLTTASKKGKQTYSRFDVADIALESIINKF